MINPNNVINFSRTDAELEEWFLFSIVVAGHNAKSTTIALENFLYPNGNNVGLSPFNVLRLYYKKGELFWRLKQSSLGNTTKNAMAFSAAINNGVDIRTASVVELMGIYGVGPKTARMFILHSRPNQELAVLDTHILKLCREWGWTKYKATPPLKEYLRLEKIYVDYLKTLGIKDFARYDLDKWSELSGASKI